RRSTTPRAARSPSRRRGPRPVRTTLSTSCESTPQHRGENVIKTRGPTTRQGPEGVSHTGRRGQDAISAMRLTGPSAGRDRPGSFLPGFADVDLRHQGNVQVRRALHALANDVADLLDFPLGHLEDELVVDLQKQPRPAAGRRERLVD